MFLGSTNYNVKPFGQKTNVSDDPVTKLRYFVYCMVVVVPALN